MAHLSLLVSIEIPFQSWNAVLFDCSSVYSFILTVISKSATQCGSRCLTMHVKFPLSIGIPRQLAKLLDAERIT